MNTVTVSPKFQVVIPRSVRREMALKPGEKLRVMRHGDRIEMIPVRPIREMRGFLKGMDTNIEREEDRL
jgi:AbrB family looped-hinge helix DNA binding protein